MTAQQQLQQVNNAIEAILKGGQSYTIGSRSLTRADLDKLNNMKANLEAQIAKEESNSLFDNTYVANFMGR